jgi:hypothetical protein
MKGAGRNVLSDVVVAVALAAGTTLLVACESGPPATPDRSGAGETSAGSVAAEIPAFHFRLGDRDVVPTARGHISTRDRRDAREAADAVRSAVTDLYVGAFLDPANWMSGSYDEVFQLFAGGAGGEALSRAGTLTAGEDAAQRFEAIEPIDGRVAMRILIDRSGKPTLIASVVRFRARGIGDEVTLIRSDGTYLFRRVDGTWRIVSFQIERADERKGAA